MITISENEVFGRIEGVQSGLLNRWTFPVKWLARMAKHYWMEGQFSLGMEYGYLLAMNDLIHGIDSTSTTLEESDELQGSVRFSDVSDDRLLTDRDILDRAISVLHAHDLSIEADKLQELMVTRGRE